MGFSLKQAETIPREVKLLDELNTRQLKFLEALLIETTFEGAYKRAGIAKATAQKYRDLPVFKEAYRNAKRKAMEQVTTSLQQASIEAVEVLKSVMNDEEAPPSSRIQAARTVLDNAYKGIELDDLAERIEKVEAFMNAK